MLNLIRETVVSYAFIERNFNLLKRYLSWEILLFQLLHRQCADDWLDYGGTWHQ